MALWLQCFAFRAAVPVEPERTAHKYVKAQKHKIIASCDVCGMAFICNADV